MIIDNFCPICNKEMDIIECKTCIKYTCLSEELYLLKSSNSGKLTATKERHYGLIKYDDGFIFMEYMLFPFFVRTDKNYTYIQSLKEMEGCITHTTNYKEYYCDFLLNTYSSMFLFKDNLEDIKNKLKYYLTFS